MMKVDPQKRQDAKNIKLEHLINIKTIAYG